MTTHNYDLHIQTYLELASFWAGSCIEPAHTMLLHLREHDASDTVERGGAGVPGCRKWSRHSLTHIRPIDAVHTCTRPQNIRFGMTLAMNAMVYCCTPAQLKH
jgi:hypothetical protein